MKALSIVALATLALAVSQNGFAIGAPNSATVALNAQNGSSEDGTATLVQGNAYSPSASR